MSENTRWRVDGNTVTDRTTGLMWMRDVSGIPKMNWHDAMEYVAALPDGPWRLPTVQEVVSLIDYGQISPALPAGHPFSGVRLDYYWSSTTHANYPSNAWNVYLNYGNVISGSKGYTNCVWPVRGDA